jgi:hypothetical protein
VISFGIKISCERGLEFIRIWPSQPKVNRSQLWSTVDLIMDLEVGSD